MNKEVSGQERKGIPCEVRIPGACHCGRSPQEWMSFRLSGDLVVHFAILRFIHTLLIAAVTETSSCVSHIYADLTEQAP